MLWKMFVLMALALSVSAQLDVESDGATMAIKRGIVDGSVGGGWQWLSQGAAQRRRSVGKKRALNYLIKRRGSMDSMNKYLIGKRRIDSMNSYLIRKRGLDSMNRYLTRKRAALFDKRRGMDSMNRYLVRKRSMDSMNRYMLGKRAV